MPPLWHVWAWGTSVQEQDYPQTGMETCNQAPNYSKHHCRRRQRRLYLDPSQSNSQAIAYNQGNSSRKRLKLFSDFDYTPRGVTGTLAIYHTQPPLMDDIVGWNVRGLNWPNKQVDISIYLNLNKAGLVGLFETKVKLSNVDKVASQVFPGWRWHHNFSLNTKGRIWIAWRPIPMPLKYFRLMNNLFIAKWHSLAHRLSSFWLGSMAWSMSSKGECYGLSWLI